MANCRLGRVALHLICILRGSDLQMHMADMMREFFRELSLWSPRAMC